ncbi:MAG: response regulator [Patescibacteria group bacterium]|nr:response regulator [Patescibacteria group bacterium]
MPSTTEKTKILIVDDEHDIANSLKKGLESRGYAIDVFIDPQEALENYKVGKYDLCIFDIRMPNMNGFQLYVEIKKLDRNVKICFCTAHESEYHEEFHKAFPELDEKYFISKPATLTQLVTRIEKELEKGSSGQHY